jgi:hypothetical protein
MRVGINTADYADFTNPLIIGITAEKVRLVMKAISKFLSLRCKKFQKETSQRWVEKFITVYSLADYDFTTHTTGGVKDCGGWPLPVIEKIEKDLTIIFRGIGDE